MPDFFAEYDERRKTEVEYYEMMHFAPPAASRSSPVEEASSSSSRSIIPSRSQRERNTVISLTDEIENSMLEELQSDDNSEAADTASEDDSHLEEDHALEGLGSRLVIEPDGQGSSFSTLDSESSELGTEDHDIALHSSVILDHLPVHSSDSFPFPLAQPLASHEDDSDGPDTSNILAELDINLVGLDTATGSQKLSSDTILPSNTEVIAYQQVLEAEDHLLQSIRTLLTVSNSPDIQTVILPHLSPRIRSQLPSTLLLNLEHSEIGISQPRSKENGPKHVPLMRQKKERRKQSYSIR